MKITKYIPLLMVYIYEILIVYDKGGMQSGLFTFCYQ